MSWLVIVTYPERIGLRQRESVLILLLETHLINWTWVLFHQTWFHFVADFISGCQVLFFCHFHSLAKADILVVAVKCDYFLIAWNSIVCGEVYSDFRSVVDSHAKKFLEGVHVRFKAFVSVVFKLGVSAHAVVQRLHVSQVFRVLYVHTFLVQGPVVDSGLQDFG